MVAQREAVRRALAQRLQQQPLVDTGAAGDGERLGQRADGLEQNHVVEDLHHLATADRPAMGDVGPHRREIGVDPLEQFRGGADHDAEPPLLRRLAGAGNGRVGEVDAGLGQARGEAAGERDGRRAAIDDDADAAAGPGDAAGAEAHLLDLAPARQREKDEVGALRQLGDRGAGDDLLRRQPLHRLGAAVRGVDLEAGFAREVGAHRLAHGAEPDESQRLDPCHVILPRAHRFSLAQAPALSYCRAPARTGELASFGNFNVCPLAYPPALLRRHARTLIAYDAI